MNNNNEKIKTILFEVKLRGQGIVNYDGKEQAKILQAFGFSETHLNGHDNNSFSKKDFQKNGEEKIIKVRISSNCLKKGIFRTTNVGENPQIAHTKEANLKYLASPNKIIRGFLQTKKNEISYRKKSAININDAIQTCDALTYMETLSRSGYKKTSKEMEGADNSFFSRETVGKIFYSFDGQIDIQTLEFISTDDIFDRLAIEEDDFEEYKKYVKMNIPSFNSQIGYYSMKTSEDPTPERGFVFNEDDCKFLIKYFLEKLLNLRIVRSNAYVDLYDLKIKMVYDPIKDTRYKEDGWIKIDSLDDIENLDLNLHQFYERCENDKTAETLRQSIKNNYEEYNKNKAEDKKKKSEESKKKKNAKTEDVNQE